MSTTLKAYSKDCFIFCSLKSKLTSTHLLSLIKEAAENPGKSLMVVAKSPQLIFNFLFLGSKSKRANQFLVIGELKATKLELSLSSLILFFPKCLIA